MTAMPRAATAFAFTELGMTKKILIVRTSSLGDLVHMLPAISDIARHVPGARIAWVVEENFAEIPAWHPAINEAIVVAHRRWRTHWWAAATRAARPARPPTLHTPRHAWGHATP